MKKQQTRIELIQDLEDYTEGQNSNIVGNPFRVFLGKLSINKLRFLLKINIDCEIHTPAELVSYLKSLIEKKYNKNIIY